MGKDFEVQSSFGHVRDLAKENMGVDVANNYSPAYLVPTEKSQSSKSPPKGSQRQRSVLATDEDREGEAIAWHLTQVLELAPENTKRIVFHEITPKAIKEAVAQPRNVDINLVNAQQARRILDRLVGFELSPLLWKKVRMRTHFLPEECKVLQLNFW